MRRFRIYAAALALFVPVICGCVPLVVGAACGALGGYALSRDTVEGATDKPYEALWGSALDVARARGDIGYEDETKGYIELTSGSSRAQVRLIRLTAAATKLRIRARKHHLPNLALAQDMFVKIMEQAK